MPPKVERSTRVRQRCNCRIYPIDFKGCKRLRVVGVASRHSLYHAWYGHRTPLPAATPPHIASRRFLLKRRAMIPLFYSNRVPCQDRPLLSSTRSGSRRCIGSSLCARRGRTSFLTPDGARVFWSRNLSRNTCRSWWQERSDDGVQETRWRGRPQGRRAAGGKGMRGGTRVKPQLAKEASG